MSVSLRPAWFPELVPGQLELYRETLSQKKVQKLTLKILCAEQH